MCIYHKPEFTHQRDLFGALFEFRLPVTTLPSVLVGQGRCVTGEAEFLGIGLFGGIDMFMPIPEPLMLERGVERAERVRQIAFDENGLAQPCSQNAIQNGASQLDCSTRIDLK